MGQRQSLQAPARGNLTQPLQPTTWLRGAGKPRGFLGVGAGAGVLNNGTVSGMTGRQSARTSRSSHTTEP